jgi:VanZ family protein
MGLPRFNVPHVDKMVHFTFYFVLVIVGVKAIQEFFTLKPTLRKVLLCAFFFAIAYGILIEFLQYWFTENRHGDIFDVLANSIGALAGMFTVKSLVSKDWALK